MATSTSNFVPLESRSSTAVPSLLKDQYVVEGDDDDITAREQSETPLPIQNNKQIKLKVRNIDIIKYLIGTIAGKDKIAKFLKCILDIIKKVSLLFPMKFYNVDTRSLATIASQLSLFRAIMRFGSAPFTIGSLINMISHNKNLLKTPSVVFNPSILESIINVYFTIFDELSLLSKLNIIKNKNLRERISRNDTLATEIDSIFSLQKACISYRKNRIQRNKKNDIMAKIDIARFTMELISNTPDLLLIRSPRIERIVSLFSSICSTISAILNLVRLWILAKDQLSVKL
ncbi:similar to Saccharomyces cerevisiae YOR193W PEX27 Peripheral peroxisomal membrane protein involved in controlling peroxisome size and number [Maudiozyma saulgeensis]|uniref:Similar to Saccharomyces cerevisiae YOR193W PEX27 Peripheral peroxisomal membrane protein involved in controlling peroxisome size and number n=1 Tax=Maudiozyma saulgeensis TaxID=1789683 RepID=A0A1X7R909_9SACH|nr:similar to Saccharomyces cerevisiae YOR193W PEX27 Peripheral peroxisomal membrane protein involved in controlling peroxisome size and number [Kazachstania saulgeensis]